MKFHGLREIEGLENFEGFVAQKGANLSEIVIVSYYKGSKTIIKKVKVSQFSRSKSPQKELKKIIIESVGGNGCYITKEVSNILETVVKLKLQKEKRGRST